MTDKELLNQALEYLEDNQHWVADGERHAYVMEYNAFIDKLKQALAQTEQEPLEYWNAVEGWVKIDEVREHFDSVGCGTIYKTAGEDRTPLYTTPPQHALMAEHWKAEYDKLKAACKPLTDEMIVAGGKALAKLHAESCGLDFDDVWKYYAEDHKADAKAAIEAAHGIKE